MHKLQLLNSKLDKLLNRYDDLQAENSRLKQTVAEQTQIIAHLNEKLAQLEQQIIGSQSGKNWGNEDEKEKMRSQLDNVIDEIDKILSTLND